MLWLWPIILIAKTVVCFGVGYGLTQAQRIFKRSDPHVKCGVLFPNAMERCGQNLDWNQFFIDGVNLYHQNYAASEIDHGLKNFLLGISVQELIVTIENDAGHGLIHLLADLEFDGNLNQTQTFLNGPADLIHLSQVLRNLDDSWDYFLGTQLLMPDKQDLKYLFELQGQHAHFDEINICIASTLEILYDELYLLRNERLSTLSAIYSMSPGASELMKSYNAGGEWNVISVLSKCIPRIARCFSEEAVHISNSVMGLCQKNKEAIRSPSANKEFSTTNYVSSIVPLSLFGSSLSVGNFLNDELCIAVGAPLEQEYGSVYIIPLSQISGRTIHTPSFALYGSSVKKLELFGTDYLVVSEPGNRALHVYQGYDKILTILDTSASFQEVDYVMDIDDDGLPDLILVSPRFLDSEVGRVVIVPGLNILPYLINGEKNQVKSIESIGCITLFGPQSISRQHYGASVTSSRDFLLVTCQNLGVIYVYRLEELASGLLPAFYIMEDNVILPNEDLPWRLERVKSSKHGLFGSKLYCWEFRGSDYIAACQPLFNSIFIYRDSGDSAIDFFTVLKLDLLGDLDTVYESIKFGTGMIFDNEEEKLYVSSPGSFNGAGAIWVITMSEILASVEVWREKKLLVNPAKHLHKVNTDPNKKGWSNFGSALALSSSNLIITIPQYGYGNLENFPLIGTILIS